MPVYGRSTSTNDDGLHRLSEVSFAVPLSDMRRIANFLLSFADKVEAGTLRSDHAHLNRPEAEWDVIAFHPAPPPPKRAM